MEHAFVFPQKVAEYLEGSGKTRLKIKHAVKTVNPVPYNKLSSKSPLNMIIITACSRQVYDLRRNHGNIATIHCTSDGNFEPLQCDMDSGLCYCVDPLTGKLDGAILPEHQWKLLPCYSLNVTNHDPTGQYLRQCESEWAAGQRIRKETLLHGLDVYAVVDFKCDYDGSFAPIRRHQSL